MTTMLAITQRSYGDSSVFQLEELPVPAPGRGEVLVRVDTAGIDRGTWHVMTGLPKIARLGLGMRRPKRLIAGLDVAGVVEAIGEGVTRLQVGERVFGPSQGGFAQLALAKETKLARVPDGVSMQHAGVLGVSGLTALQALDAAKLDSGQRVLITGASGGVGHLCVQLAAARGAEVTAVCSAAKADAVRGFGATHVLDYRAHDPYETDTPYDAIIDIASGLPLTRMRRALAERGTIVFVGDENDAAWFGGLGQPMRAAMRMAFARQRFVMLVSREHFSDLERLAALAAAGDVTPHVHAVHALDQVPAAIDELVAGTVIGKLAIDVAATSSS